MTNRTAGNRFEQEFCDLAAQHGFYAHNNVQSKAGQPFDVQLCKDDVCYQVDCKVCEEEDFPVRNIRPNQHTAFRLLEDCGCKNNLIVVRFVPWGNRIYYIRYYRANLYSITIPFSEFIPIERLFDK